MLWGFGFLLFVASLHRTVANSGLDAWVSVASTESVKPLSSVFPFFDAVAATSMSVKNEESKPRREMCRWDTYYGECIPDEWYIFSLVQQSKSELGHLYAPFLKMKYEIDAEPMFRTQKAIEISYADSILKHLGQYASSPCFNDVSTLWRVTTVSTMCRNLRRKTDCLAEPSCTWMWKTKRCVIDSWYLLYNIKSQSNVPKHLGDIVASYAHDYLIAFEDRFGNQFMEDQFDWDSILEWNIDYVCPFKNQGPVCTYALGFTEIFPTSMYCAGKYPSFFQVHECHADPLCQPSIAPGPLCGPSDQEVHRSKSDALSIFLDGIKDPFLREIYSMSALCDSHEIQRTCERNRQTTCQWSFEDRACIMSERWVGVKLSRPDARDPLCFLFSMPVRSECLEIRHFFTCILKEACEWKNTPGTCEPKVRVFLRAIGQEDPEMTINLRNAKNTCGLRNKKMCPSTVLPA